MQIKTGFTQKFRSCKPLSAWAKRPSGGWPAQVYRKDQDIAPNDPLECSVKTFESSFRLHLSDLREPDKPVQESKAAIIKALGRSQGGSFFPLDRAKLIDFNENRRIRALARQRSIRKQILASRSQKGAQKCGRYSCRLRVIVSPPDNVTLETEKLVPQLQFWFEFTSTYSYLSAMRIEKLAAEQAVDVVWKPFLLGPIFDAQGWNTSPFDIYPQKGNYMWRDVERRAKEHGLVFRRPSQFPQNSLKAARVAQMALQTANGPEFVRAVYRAAFAEGAVISDDSVIASCLKEAGLPTHLLKGANEDENKTNLKTAVEEAQAHGIFGAPSFTVGQELFWGDDRLETALGWAQTL